MKRVRNSILKRALGLGHWAFALGPLDRTLENAITIPFVIPLHMSYNFIEAAYNKMMSLL